ncbi:MAG: uroporphyrinogen-III synthase [Pseudohongiellaceae bacterium]
MAAPLAGLTVLLTRAEPLLSESVRALEEAGARVLAIPLIRIEPVHEPAAVQSVKNAVMELDRYDMAIFISTNAARLGMEWIDRYWPQLPRDLTAWSVGPGTARVLEEFTWPVQCPPEGVTSEALLDMPEMRDVDGKRIALFRGVGGRETLAAKLRERGATVDYIELYVREPRPEAADELAAALAEESVDAVVASSLQITQELEGLVEKVPGGGRLLGIPLLVPSERVAAYAREAGFEHVINAGGAGDNAVLSALASLRD